MYLLLADTNVGNNRYKQIERGLKRILDHHQIKYQIITIDNLVNITELLNRHIKDNTQAVVAIGDDGTVANIIDILVDHEVPLGIIPINRTNNLAYMLGIKSWQAGAKLLADHKIHNQRLGKVGKHYFIGSLIIAPRRNLLTDILNKQSWLKRFLGTNIASNLRGSHNVACRLNLDNELEVQCQISSITIHLNGEGKRKMKIITAALTNNKKLEQSIFRANRLAITSSLNMPILSGNETIASTPATIQVINKTIPIIQSPQSKSSMIN